MVAALAVSWTGAPAGAESTAVLPDLVADPVTNPVAVTYSDTLGERWLLRFDGYVHNQGQGALELRASGPVGGEMSDVRQRVYDSDGGFADLVSTPPPRVLFEPADRHDHWHLRAAARYSLWDSARTAEVAPSEKVGFCLLDFERVDPWAHAGAAYSSFCEQHNPGASEVTMGVSAGWRDTYRRSLAFQWVNISEVMPGRYSLRAEVDPDGVILESDEDNPPAFVDVDVPGYVARSFGVQVGQLLPSVIELRADRFGAPGTRQYRIDELPKHGTLVNRQRGVWFSDSSVTYLPDLDAGQDSFRFSARDASNPFPVSPVSATVSVGVGTAPQSLALDDPGVRPIALGPARRAPDVDAPLPVPDGAALAAPQVEVRDGNLLVRTVAWRRGTVRMSVHGGALDGRSCRAAIPAGQAFTCLLASGVTRDQLRGARVMATSHVGERLVGARETRLN